MELDDRSADLEAAFEEFEEEEENEGTDPPAPEGDDEPPAPAEGEEEEGEEEEGEEQPADEKPKGKSKDKPDTKELEKGDVKAPVSWKPEAREAWAKIPEGAKSEIMRREREVSQALNESAGARKFTGEFSQMIQPYMPFIAAEGSHPMQAVNYLLQTAAGLRVGTPQQKTAIIHELISTYGIDVKMLDSMLVGEDPGNPSPEQIQQMVDQRVQDHLRQFQPQSNTGIDPQAIQRQIDEFATDPENEFFNDVSNEMGFVMEAAAKRGQKLTLKQAYDKALLMRDDIQAVVKSRSVQPPAVSNAERRRRAGKSLRPGKPSGSAVSGTNSTRVDDIAAAWDAVQGE